jgi:YfiH family protein
VSRGEIVDRRPLDDGRTAVVAVSDRHDGDLQVDLDPDRLEARRRTITRHPWSWLRQVHGSDVVTVSAPGAEAGSHADGLITEVSGAALAVHTADCAPVGLVAATGVVGVAHVGWRGLAAGILGATVDAMHSAGAEQLSAVVGPCIHAGCYEFGEEDLAVVAESVGAEVRAVTGAGRPALDLPAGVLAALARSGVTDVAVDSRCTSCDGDRFSHRARGDRGRQALVVWIDP